MAVRKQELLPFTDASLGMLQVLGPGPGPGPALALLSAIQGLSFVLMPTIANPLFPISAHSSIVCD